MISIFINSEKYVINSQNHFNYSKILNLSGYPISDKYVIVDEKTNQKYTKFDDEVIVYSNMSLVIYIK